MRRITIFFSILMLLLLEGSLTFATDTHTTGHSSVDGTEIRYESDSWYSSNRDAAITNWNSLNPIDILPDTIWSITDVTIWDRYDPDVDWAGIFSWISVPDGILINNYWLDQYSSDQRTDVFAHELGHALGLGDHESSTYNQTLMYFEVNGITTPQSHDIADYNSLWN